MLRDQNKNYGSDTSYFKTSVGKGFHLRCRCDDRGPPGPQLSAGPSPASRTAAHTARAQRPETVTPTAHMTDPQTRCCGFLTHWSSWIGLGRKSKQEDLEAVRSPYSPTR